MKSKLMFGLAIAALATTAFAQEREYTVLDGSTSATARSTTGTEAMATTATQNMGRNAASTTGSRYMAQRYSQENFDRSWKVESDMMKEAGISDEKIEKMHEITKKMWDARAKGETADWQELVKERAAVLSPEDMQKFREARQEAMKRQMGATGAGHTSGTR